MSATLPESAAAGVPVPGGELIYEVTLDVPRRTVRRLDAWLAAHMREMLALPGFLAAQLLPVEQVAPVPDPHRARRVVRYRLASYQAFEDYLHQHAARLRADGVRQFGKQLQARRRLLDSDGRELQAGALLPQATARCLNCGTPLTGKFCANCGQPHHADMAPLGEVLEEFFGEHLGLDTKFMRSVGPLWWRPGFLTREYSAGRRQRYISPLRLYIFSSLLFFLIAWGSAPAQFFHFNGKHGAAARAAPAKALTKQQQQDILGIPYLSTQQKQAILAAASHGARTGQTPAASDGGEVSGTIFGQHINMSRAELEYRVQHALESDLPKLMFLFLPLVALLLKLFYLGSGRYYMEHLIFTLHTHAFVFEAMLLMLLMHLLGQRLAWAAVPAHYLNVLIGWYIAIYVFLAMWFYYRQSFLKTLGKYILAGAIYWIALMGVIVGGAMWALTTALGA